MTEFDDVSRRFVVAFLEQKHSLLAGEDFTVKLSSLFRSMSHSAFHKNPRGAIPSTKTNFGPTLAGLSYQSLAKLGHY